jgi:hypothetical protein
MAKVYSTVFWQRIRLAQMGPQDPKDVTRYTARHLSALVGEHAALKGEATHWPTDLEYGVLRYRLEIAHAAAEVALVEARRSVRETFIWGDHKEEPRKERLCPTTLTTIPLGVRENTTTR